MFRSPKLLKAARGQPCLLCLAGCNRDPSTTVAAHSNMSRHGKGAGLKAHDCYSVWACYSCHQALDGQAGHLTRQEREEAFMRAWERQVLLWFEQGIVKVA